MKHALDERYCTTASVTHDQQYIDQCLAVVSLCDIPVNMIHPSTCLFIDEAQFFPNLVAEVTTLLPYVKSITIAGLSADSEQQQYEHMSALCTLTSSHTQLLSVCAVCSSYTARHTVRCPRVFVGGSSVYSPICTQCLNAGLASSIEWATTL